MSEPSNDEAAVYRFDDLELDVGLQRVLRGGVEVPLPKLSFDFLLALVEAAPNVVPQRRLLARVWPSLVVTDKTVSQRVKLLRDALGDDPENPRYIVVLRGRGYRLKPSVERRERVRAALSAGTSDPGVPDNARIPETAPVKRSAVRAAGLAGVVALLMALVILIIPDEPSRGVEPADAPALGAAVAVLPFRNVSEDAGEAYLALGIAETVLEQLSAVDGLRVISRGSSFKDSLADRDATEVGARLNARYLVDGSVQRMGRTLHVSARLVDAESSEQMWAQLFDRPAEDIFEIEEEIAERVTAAIRLRLRGVGALTSVAPTKSVDAYLAYLRGRAAIANWTAAAADIAEASFAEAIRLDPTFAAAYAARYDARMMAEDRRGGAAAPQLASRALAAARVENEPLISRALELDPASGTAYFVRAIWSDGPPAEREADFRRGLELDPSNGRGTTAFAEFLDKVGREDEAERMLARAIEIDPLGARAHFWRVQRTFNAGSADQLEEGMLRVLEIDPDYQPALQRYSKYRWIRHGALAQALQTLEHASSLDPDNAWLAHTLVAVYLDIGDVAAARAVLAETARPQASGDLLLYLHDGEIESAAAAAFGETAFANGPGEAWGVFEALLDGAMLNGDSTRALDYIMEHVTFASGVKVNNFRAVPAVARLLQTLGRRAEARQLLADCIAWVDAYHVPNLGNVYALRVKATALQLLGETDLALAALDASFRAHDYVQWWYTLERDPVWKPLHSDPRFVAILQRAREHVASEAAALETLRERGLVPRRVAVVAARTDP